MLLHCYFNLDNHWAMLFMSQILIDTTLWDVEDNYKECENAGKG